MKHPYALLLLFTVCAALAALAGCGGTSADSTPSRDGEDQASALARVRDAGVLVVAIANEEPYAYLDESGKATGEAPEIARVIAERLGVAEVEAVNVEWKALIPGLKARRFDCIAAGMYITPERAANVAFSDPTYRIGEAFLVQTGNPKGLTSYASVAEHADAKLGVVRGTVEVGYAKDLNVPDDRVVVFADNATAALAVKNGQVDAFAGTALTVQRIAEKYAEDGSVERAADFEQPVIDGKAVYGYGAFAFRPEDDDLRDAWNKELAGFLGTPEHLALVKPFGFTDNELPKLTAEQVLEQAK